jgi:hypothetical protein
VDLGYFRIGAIDFERSWLDQRLASSEYIEPEFKLVNLQNPLLWFGKRVIDGCLFVAVIGVNPSIDPKALVL